MAGRWNWKEAAGVTAVLAVLLGLPLLLWQWRQHVLYRHPADTKVFVLTAVAKPGMWTQDEIAGWNYWWKQPAPVRQIALKQGDKVRLRLRSADVLHSFAIPLLHLGPVEVNSGHTVDVQFSADRPGNLTFLCWQVCSPEHSNLHGRFVVEGNEKDSW